MCRFGPYLALIIFAVCQTGCQTASVAVTSGFRDDGTGRYPQADPPVIWSSEGNLVWKTSMPSWSNASPVLHVETNMLFVGSEPNQILRIGVEDGNILWQRSVADVTPEEPAGTHDTNGYTSPTPVTDGQTVYTVFATGVVAAYEVSGRRKWARVVEVPDIVFGYSASPVLAGGLLIVHINDLIGLDPATGKEVWRSTSEMKYGSPVMTTIGATDIVITPSGDVYRASDGRRLAQDLGKLEYATPVVVDGTVYFIEKKATAAKLPTSLGESFDAQQLWEARIQGSRHYSSPVVHDGRVYAISREEMFTILDAATGDILFEKKLDLGEGGNSAYASITLAGDKLFVGAETGTTVVLQPGATYLEIGRNEIGQWRSTPVFSGRRVYIRAYDYLYCFEKN